MLKSNPPVRVETNVMELTMECAELKAQLENAISWIPRVCKTCEYGTSPCDWCNDGMDHWEWNGKSKGELSIKNLRIIDELPPLNDDYVRERV